MADGGTWTVRRVLEWTSGFFSRKTVDQPRLSAELLLAHILQCPRIKLYTDYERPLTEAELASYRQLVHARLRKSRSHISLVRHISSIWNSMLCAMC